MHQKFNEKRAEVIEQLVLAITEAVDDFADKHPLSGAEVIGAVEYFKWNYFCREGDEQHGND